MPIPSYKRLPPTEPFSARATSRWIYVSALSVSLLTSSTSCIKRHQTATVQVISEQRSAYPSRININTASANELETLPGVGKSLAERIIEHREHYGHFRRIEHLIIVRGISDKKFRAVQDLITVE